MKKFPKIVPLSFRKPPTKRRHQNKCNMQKLKSFMVIFVNYVRNGRCRRLLCEQIFRLKNVLKSSKNNHACVLKHDCVLEPKSFLKCPLAFNVSYIYCHTWTNTKTTGLCVAWWDFALCMRGRRKFASVERHFEWFFLRFI